MDNATRRQKQQALMTELIERKIRLHARHLYDKRGQGEGSALQDWVEAETLVLENSILAPLYRRSRTNGRGEFNGSENQQVPFLDSSASESGA